MINTRHIVSGLAAMAAAVVPQPDWGAISEAKQAEADRYYGRGHAAGHTPTAQGADKRRAKRKASRKARKAAR